MKKIDASKDKSASPNNEILVYENIARGTQDYKTTSNNSDKNSIFKKVNKSHSKDASSKRNSKAMLEDSKGLYHITHSIDSKKSGNSFLKRNRKIDQRNDCGKIGDLDVNKWYTSEEIID